MNRNLQHAQFSREGLRDDMRLAQHAQDLRAENYGMGYKSETAGFYGSDKVAQAGTSERRLTVAAADGEHSRRTAADREQGGAHKPMGSEEREAMHRQLESSGW